MALTGRFGARERSAVRLAAAGLAVLFVWHVVLVVRAGGSAADGGTTLVVWDGFVGARAEAAERVYDAFARSQPEIAIERRVLAGAAAEPAALTTALASGVGPDVLATEADAAFREELADAPLLVALNELPVRYGWTDRLDGTAQRWARRDGRLYALPVDQAFLGLYVNRALTDEALLRAPRTAAELLDFCRQARAKGYVPFAVGADPGAELGDLFAMALNNSIGPSLTRALLFTDWGLWETTRVGWALRLVAVEMPRAGCYDVGAAAPADARALFAEGRALLLPGSSAGAAGLEAAMAGTALEIAAFPTIEGGQGRVLPTSAGAAYAIGARSAHPREAAMLLDFVVSEEAARIWVEEGGMAPPLAVDVGGWRLTALQENALDLAAETRRRSIFRARVDAGYAIDPIDPDGFARAVVDGLAATLAGTSTPEETATELQLAWAEREG